MRPRSSTTSSPRRIFRIASAARSRTTPRCAGRAAGSLDISDWLEAGGGESGFIAPRYDNPDIVYAGSYGNLLTRKDMQTGISVNVNPWPDNPMGHPATISSTASSGRSRSSSRSTTPNIVYAGSQHIHKTTNGGKSWTVISPDLTYHDPATLGNSGGPLTKDQTSVEYYATVFTIEESPITPKTIWTGSDDGKVYVTRDGGMKWNDVTPKDMAKFTRVSSIDASKFGECIAYVAANRYQLDDDSPYLWKTTDCGASWTRIDNGIPATEFTRVVREDPGKRGLLVAGTERGVWFSSDDGAHWQSLRLNLPYRARARSHIQAGRSHRRHARPRLLHHGRHLDARADDRRGRRASAAHLFKPRDQYRLATGGGWRRWWRRWWRRRASGHAGKRARCIRPEQNPPTGVTVQFWLKTGGETVGLDFLDATGKMIRSYSSKADSAATPAPAAGGDEGFGPPPQAPARPEPQRRQHVPMEHSLSRCVGVSWNDSLGGRRDRSARSARHVQSANDSRRHTGRDGNVQGAARSAHQGDARRVAGTVARRAADSRPVLRGERRREGDSPPQGRARGSSARKCRRPRRTRTLALSATFATGSVEVEDSLYQTKNRSGQDPLNYPIRLNNRIGALMGVVASSDGKPTQQTYDVYKVVS